MHLHWINHLAVTTKTSTVSAERTIDEPTSGPKVFFFFFFLYFISWLPTTLHIFPLQKGREMSDMCCTSITWLPCMYWYQSKSKAKYHIPFPLSLFLSQLSTLQMKFPLVLPLSMFQGTSHSHYSSVSRHFFVAKMLNVRCGGQPMPPPPSEWDSWKGRFKMPPLYHGL